MTRQLILALIAAAMLLAVGVYHGLATDRWSDPESTDAPGRWLAELPLAVGDWRGEMLPRNGDDDPKAAAAHFRFTQANSPRWVLTAVSSGRPGRVAVHNPEHCYLGSGYQVVDDIRTESLPAGPRDSAIFWTGHFQKKKPTGVESIRIWWGWTTDGDWQAPNYPRLFFAGKARLHKLYMIHPVAATESADEQAAYRDFMVQYVNELNRHLAP